MTEVHQLGADVSIPPRYPSSLTRSRRHPNSAPQPEITHALLTSNEEVPPTSSRGSSGVRCITPKGSSSPATDDLAPHHNHSILNNNSNNSNKENTLEECGATPPLWRCPSGMTLTPSEDFSVQPTPPSSTAPTRNPRMAAIRQASSAKQQQQQQQHGSAVHHNHNSHQHTTTNSSSVPSSATTPLAAPPPAANTLTGPLFEVNGTPIPCVLSLESITDSMDGESVNVPSTMQQRRIAAPSKPLLQLLHNSSSESTFHEVPVSVGDGDVEDGGDGACSEGGPLDHFSPAPPSREEVATTLVRIASGGVKSSNSKPSTTRGCGPHARRVVAAPTTGALHDEYRSGNTSLSSNDTATGRQTIAHSDSFHCFSTTVGSGTGWGKRSSKRDLQREEESEEAHSDGNPLARVAGVARRTANLVVAASVVPQTNGDDEDDVSGVMDVADASSSSIDFGAIRFNPSTASSMAELQVIPSSTELCALPTSFSKQRRTSSTRASIVNTPPSRSSSSTSATPPLRTANFVVPNSDSTYNSGGTAVVVEDVPSSSSLYSRTCIFHNSAAVGRQSIFSMTASSPITDFVADGGGVSYHSPLQHHSPTTPELPSLSMKESRRASLHRSSLASFAAQRRPCQQKHAITTSAILAFFGPSLSKMDEEQQTPPARRMTQVVSPSCGTQQPMLAVMRHNYSSLGLIERDDGERTPLGHHHHHHHHHHHSSSHSHHHAQASVQLSPRRSPPHPPPKHTTPSATHGSSADISPRSPVRSAVASMHHQSSHGSFFCQMDPNEAQHMMLINHNHIINNNSNSNNSANYGMGGVGLLQTRAFVSVAQDGSQLGLWSPNTPTIHSPSITTVESAIIISPLTSLTPPSGA